jgi:hypothetical protein
MTENKRERDAIGLASTTLTAAFLALGQLHFFCAVSGIFERV